MWALKHVSLWRLLALRLWTFTVFETTQCFTFDHVKSARTILPQSVLSVANSDGEVTLLPIALRCDE